MENQLSYLAVSLKDFLEPVRRMLGSFEGFEYTAWRYGWKVSLEAEQYAGLSELINIQTELSSLENVVTTIQSRLDADSHASISAQEYLAILDPAITLVQNLMRLEVPATAGLPAPLDKAAFWTDIGDHLVDDLMEQFIKMRFPKTYLFLHLFGVIRYEKSIPATEHRLTYTRTIFDWQQMDEVLTNPWTAFKKIYHWNDPSIPFDHRRLLAALQKVINAIGISAKISAPDITFLSSIDPASPLQVRAGADSLKIMFLYRLSLVEDLIYEFGLDLYPAFNRSADTNTGLLFRPVMRGGVSQVFPIGNDFTLTWNATAENMAAIAVFPDHTELLTSAPLVGTSLVLTRSSEEAWYLLGSKDATRIELSTFSAGISVEGSATEPNLRLIVQVGADSKPCKAVILLGESDGFVRKIMGSGVELDFTAGVSWSTLGGLRFNSSAGLNFKIPVHKKVGPVSIHEAGVRLQKAGGEYAGADLIFGLDIGGKMGPVSFTIDDMGFVVSAITYSADEIKNLPADALKPLFGKIALDMGFKPPSGLGVVISAGGITGGGFMKFEPDKYEYSGALELTFRNLFSLKAFGILNTRMPDGSAGYSLLIVITAEFSPVQLGFGFTLMSVGGLLGLHRAVNIEAVRTGIRTNSVRSIMFPENVTENISRILSDVQQFFPVQQNHFLLCPMGRIGWGTPALLTIDLGILIELPSGKINILGILRAILPDERTPVLQLQVNFLGQIDAGKKLIAFDAILFDSKLLLFTLSGQMALRISWGDSASFLLSVGGLHPAFKEVPGDLIGMQRLSISLLSGRNPRITMQAYFAVTSNTAQFGARIELYAEGGSFNIFGFVGFDVLFRLDPFYFMADFTAGLALRRNTSVICSITVNGSLSGPGPWDVKGKASISFFFFSVSVGFHETWGEQVGDQGAGSVELLPLLKIEINDDRNWKADLPAHNNLLVTLRTSEDHDHLPIHPAGILSFRETLVPLETEVSKLGTKGISGAKRFTIKTEGDVFASESIDDDFAPANYLELDDEEKLSRASFEKMPAGFRVNASENLKGSVRVDTNVVYEARYVGKKRKTVVKGGGYHLPGSIFNAALSGASVSRSTVSQLNPVTGKNAPAPIRIRQEGFLIAGMDDLAPIDAEPAVLSYTAAIEKLRKVSRAQPGLKNKIQVVREFETL